MRALVVPRNGGAEVLEVLELPDPQPGPGEVVLDVAASGVNFIEVYQRQGGYAVATPFVLGEECAGRVAAVGPDVRGLREGDLVATVDARGAHASRTTVAAERAVPVPRGVGAEIAAALLLQGMTAHYLLGSTFPVTAGTRLLVHAAAGGVGQLLVQLAKAKGATVIATTGSAAKAKIASDLGADAVLRYDEIAGTDGTDGLAAAVREASGGGVDVAYDGVGAATFEASLASLRPRGMLVLFGAASGPVPPFDLQRLNAAGSLFVTRPTLRHYIATGAELGWRARDLFDAVVAGTLHVEIGGRYGLAAAADAYRALEGRRTTGKVLLVP